MRAFPVLEAIPSASAVLVDNLTLSSSDRLLRGGYETAAAEAGVTGGLTDSQVSAMVTHDLACLTTLLESIIGFDEIYTNAQKADRWSKGNTTLDPLDRIIAGLALSREQQWEADSFISRHASAVHAGPLGSNELEALCYGHPQYCGTSTALGPALDKLTAPFDESSRPFGRHHGVAVGVGAYSLLSELLGVPYRPSPLRSRVLKDLLKQEIREWRMHAGSVAIQYLEKEREKAAREYFERLAELNCVETRVPLILGGILANVDDVAQILPLALDLRDSQEGRDFRTWSTSMTQTIQEGDLGDIMKLQSELDGIIRSVHRSLGMKETPKSGASDVTLTLGFGPISAKTAFSVGSIWGRKTRVDRHLWLLQGLYRSLAGVVSFSAHFDRVFRPSLTPWTRQHLRLDWSNMD